MSGAEAIAALRHETAWPAPILMPSAAGLGARLEGRAASDLRGSAQGLADACLSAARFLDADAVWISALAPDEGADFAAGFLHDAAMRAIAAARTARLGAAVELRGPLFRALEVGGDLDAALKVVKPAMIAEFEAIAKLRPDIIVLADPRADPPQAESRALARIYGALKRLAEHYDILKGMAPAQPGMTGPGAPDLDFGDALSPGRTGRAHGIAPDWSAAQTFARSVDDALTAALREGAALIVSGRAGLSATQDPETVRNTVQGIRDRA
ncbi:hypothetical protein [Antarcticimicrobium luteum]|uniref:Aldolase n=1 Tax=Antarcticimicrobium luteum TaxID=2547397 RepID=A0A4R5V878_9RHOB|nr:hypothetical protein [Antarcticimicrobium luteum]TDK48081.1 hypothetical protein E1832_10495 [Antarcticimicrobium luteum]